MAVVYMEGTSIDALSKKDIKDLVAGHMPTSRYDKLERYYRAEHDILQYYKRDRHTPNNQIVHNLPKYITDTATGYFIGRPVVYASQDEAYMSALQDIYDYNDEQDHNAELAKTCSIDGHAIEMLYIDEDARIRFAPVYPGNVLLLCETGGDTPRAVIRRIPSRDKDGNHIERVEWWTQDKVLYLAAKNGGNYEVVGEQEHYWHDVPYIEYVNNAERLGDYESIVPLVDAYNKATSNMANMLEYNDAAILTISKMGDVNAQDIRELREQENAISLDEGGAIDWLVKHIDDAAIQHHQDRLREDIHTISGVPNMADKEFSGNASGVAMEYKLWGLEQLCAIKERKFKRGLQRRIELITTILNIQGNHYDYRDIEIQFRRNKPNNLLEITQVMGNLAGELSRESRLKLLPTVDDPQAEIDKLAEEQRTELQGFGAAGDYTQLAGALDSAAEDGAPKGAE